MRSLHDAVDCHRGLSEADEASYPHLLAALDKLNAEIAAAHAAEVESALYDIWQTMNELGITVGQLARYRTSRLPPRECETMYRNSQTGSTWNGRGQAPEWLRGKA
jgi:DNA-binding protein H-NS